MFTSISNNGGHGIEVGENSVIQLGEDFGSSIFDSSNATTAVNTGFGIHCTTGGTADGHQGSLNGAGGAIGFDPTCANGLVP